MPCGNRYPTLGSYYSNSTVKTLNMRRRKHQVNYPTDPVYIQYMQFSGNILLT